MMATIEQADACFHHSVKRMKALSEEGYGEGWEPFKMCFWMKDLNRGYLLKFKENGILEDSEIVTKEPTDVSAVVIMTSDDWVGQHTKEVDLAEKYYSGEMKIKGDVAALQRYKTFASYEPYYPPGHPKYKGESG
ncbi:MAG: SCP2 sterol-binding domain-containing protein [Candidatus Freyarchaeota archaeon]|nr:SCP2 sterol-binding domain-containing protein [Candidatus Jordarchaeia archaeon]MBS7281646.1 SCP2 sterol-binding domain-containing protein [Candidatus Jordarchaeia archaeon]